MEEKCGTTQVDEDSPLEELESSDELIGDLCGEGGTRDNSSICMPICFLVREQAKSLIAIKDLQKRLHQVEGVQGDVVTAISDVHDYLTVAAEGGSFGGSPSPKSCSSKSPQCLEKSPGSDNPQSGSPVSPLRTKLSALNSPSNMDKNWSQQHLKAKNLDVDLQVLAPKFGMARGKDTAPESDKQDSGLDSGCREQGQESNPSQSDAQVLYSAVPLVVPTKSSDELLDLLDEIGEKSEILRQHVSGLDESPNQCSHLSNEMTKLHIEQLGLKNLLCSIKEERDDLKAKLMNLEHTTRELATEKKDIEQRFLSTLVEKHKLETKIQSIKPFSRGSLGYSPRRDYRTGNDANLSNVERTLVYKVDSETVSAVLKETNTIDLQKQVLTYMMENEVLRAKIDQIGQLVAAKELEKETSERALGDEMKNLSQENDQFRIAYDEQKVEIATLHSRVRILEKLLQSVTFENQELHAQLAESFYLKGRNQKSKFANLSSSDSPCAYPVRRLSMPARHINDPDVSVSCAKAKLLSNTSSYIDVTFEDKERDSTLEPSGFVLRKASTPLNPAKKHEKPNFSDLPSALGLTVDSHVGPCPTGERKPNKRLTFNSMKNLAPPSNICYSGREPYYGRTANNSNSCDKSSRRAAEPVIRPLESIQEKGQDVKKFPFFTILQKLKANSDYKLPNAASSLDGLEDDEGAPTTISSTIKGEGPPSTAPPRKNCNGISEAAAEDCVSSSKDKRAGSKNIHRRIQNILDRITAESDSASTVPASMI